MSQKTILITRPKERAKDLDKELNKLGYEVVYQPVLDVNLLPFELPNNTNIIITTSQYAIDGLAITKHYDTKLYVVGEASANKANKLGFTNIITAGGTASKLAELIKNNESKNSNILYLRGNEIRTDITNILRQDNYKINEIITYNAELVKELQQNIVTKLKEDKIDYVIFFSARSAKNFEELLAKYGLTNSRRKIKAISMSAIIRDSLYNQHWQSSIISNGTATQKILDLLPSQM